MKKLILPALILLGSLSINAQTKYTEHIKLLSGHSSDVGAVSFSPKNMYLASAGADNMVNIYKADSPFTKITSFKSHSTPINVIRFNRLGNMMLTASTAPNDFAIFVYDSVFKKTKEFLGHSANINTAIFDNSSRFVFSGSEDGKIFLWDIKSGKNFKQIVNGHAVNSIAMNNDPRFLFVAGAEPKIKVYSIANGQVARSFDGHLDAVNTIEISPNNKFLLSGSNDKTARIWDMMTGKELRKLPVDCWKVTAVAFSDDSKYAITGCNDGSIKVWEVETGKLVSSVEAQYYNIRDISLSKNYKYIATAPMLRSGEDFGVRIYPSGIELPQSSTSINKIYYPYAPLDSIMKLRTLTKTDSLKYKKQIGIFEEFNKVKNKGISPSNKLDSVRFYKTPMTKPSTIK
jgi:WD40 repeat protein